MADSGASSQLPEKTRALLQDLWERNLPIIHGRLNLLDEAANSEPLPDKLRIDAMNVAHKLAGSLGMFGFTEGTRLARQLELALDVPAPDSAYVALLSRQLREELFPSSSPTAP
jgi:HPt (histidine-containing phosphotransfer) domain-containing protein